MTDAAGTFAAVFTTLYAAHQVADHWIQTQYQADTKAQPGWPGRLACLAHVASYTTTAAIALTAAAYLGNLHLSITRVTAALTVSAVSHYIADRRAPLRALADACRKAPAWLENGGGLYALDQSWHIGWLWIAALIATTGH
jgi:hypothetical protein